MNRRWILLALIFTGILISYVDRGNLSIAAPALMREFALSPASTGTLLSAFFWTYAAFQLPAGLLVDRCGVRWTYALAFSVWSLASAATALSSLWEHILLLRIVLGMAEAVAPLASLSVIRRYFTGADQGLPVSVYIAGQTIGPACGALLGSTLLARFGWRVMFAVTGLGALLWAPVWLYFAPNHKLRRTSVERSQQHKKVSWPSILKSRAFWAMSICVFFFSYYWYFILTWMPAYLTIERRFPMIRMGYILSMPLFAMAVLNVMAGWFADRLISRGKELFLIRIWFSAGGLLGAALIFLLKVLPAAGIVLPVLMLSICSFGVANSNLWALSQHVAPASMVGRVMGYLNTVSQLGGATAPLITGWSLGTQRNFGVAIVIVSISPVIACVLLLVAGPRGLQRLKEKLAT